MMGQSLPVSAGLGKQLEPSADQPKEDEQQKETRGDFQACVVLVTSILLGVMRCVLHVLRLVALLRWPLLRPCAACTRYAPPAVKVSFWLVLNEAAGMFACMRLHSLALRGWGWHVQRCIQFQYGGAAGCGGYRAHMNSDTVEAWITHGFRIRLGWHVWTIRSTFELRIPEPCPRCCNSLALPAALGC